MLGVVRQDNESGLKEVKSERDLLPQKTFSTKGTNTEIAAVGNDRFLTWLFNKAYNVCMKEKERTVVEETDANLMTVVSPQQAVEGAEDGIEVSDKCGDNIVNISVRSDAASDDHETDLICTAAGKLAGKKKVVDHKKRKGTRPLKEKIIKVLKCTYCFKTFKSKRNLTFHQREHTKVQLYTTKICEKKSTMQSNYLQIHTGEKRYKCTVCDKAFSTKENLKRHFRIHTGEKPYKCIHCDKAFIAKDSLNIHLRIHTGEKPYKCTVCEKAFTTNGNLKKHLRVHTGEKPYKCTVCDKAFTQIGTLNRHLQIHSGKKPYKSIVCDNAFTQIGTLNRHLQIHLSC